MILKVSHINGPRLADEIVVYENIPSTGTNPYGMEAVVEDANLSALGERIAAEQPARHTLQALLSDNVPTKQRQPARQSATVTIRIAIGHIDSLLQDIIT